MPTTLARTGHVGINVADLSRSVDFYAQALGLEVVGRSDDDGRRYAFLGHDGALVLTLWEQATTGFDASAAGLHHLSFQADDIDQVREVEQRLRSLGAELVHDGVVPHGEGAASGGVFFLDPDGTRLEVFAPTGAEGPLRRRTGRPAGSSDARAGWRYPPGERAMQERAGCGPRPTATPAGFAATSPEVAGAFLAQQPFVVVGWRAPAGGVWCSWLAGAPGFLHGRGREPVAIEAASRPGDPIAGLADGDHVGLLAIEPATRRRMRVNGVARRRRRLAGRGCRRGDLELPSFITPRDVAPAATGPVRRAGARGQGRGPPRPPTGRSSRRPTRSSWPRPRRRASTPRTAAASPASSRSRATPAWLAGLPRQRHVPQPGQPGADPHAGILVVDWATGATLQLTGRAHVDWDSPTDRTVVFDLVTAHRLTADRASPSSTDMAQVGGAADGPLGDRRRGDIGP